MLSGVFNAAFSYLSTFSTSSSEQQGVRYSTADGEGSNSTAMSPTTTETIGRRQRLQVEQDTLQDTLQDRRKKLEDPLVRTDTTGLLSQLLLIDHQITRSIGFFAHPRTKLERVVKRCCKVLEISGHGVPWFSISGLLLVLYFWTGNRTFFDYGLNMLMLLIVDILVVAPVKLIVKRPRPSLNIGEIPLSMSSIDKYAFPSGHTSRCIAMAAYFCYMPPFNPWTHLWYIWALLVSLSRVALARHHISDVGAGIIAGLIIFDIVRRFGVLFGV